MEKADKFNETLEDMKKDQLEIKHTLTEIKNIIQRPNSRLEDRKHQLKDLEYKEAKDTAPEKYEEKRIQKVEDSVRSLWDNFKRTNIRIMGVPEEEREQDAENLFEEIMNENFPHLMKEIDLQVQEAHRTPNKRNPKRTTPRHIIIKMPRAKDKERILQAAREKQLVTYKGAPIRLSANFSTETMQARREWQEIFKVMNSKNLQPRLLYPAKLSFRIEGQIKSFTDKKKLKEFITTKPVLYEMLKVLHMRGTISHEHPWEVMSNLNFYRDPEDIEKSRLLLKRIVTKEEFQGEWTAPASEFTAAQSEITDWSEGAGVFCAYSAVSY
ncbi:hypothetical protein QTO34_000606 [Cnephaeus nilssonii]|uniref:L1 transposable element RRM domain-containing protein n=1 Tax=Cnephaeus nilssonii TaxID=3371016 RepID=A0AA40ICK7_CNENI|nr:hypothetical protein QTO34_000606 [Eptesicus nilssonii]